MSSSSNFAFKIYSQALMFLWASISTKPAYNRFGKHREESSTRAKKSPDSHPPSPKSQRISSLLEGWLQYSTSCRCCFSKSHKIPSAISCKVVAHLANLFKFSWYQLMKFDWQNHVFLYIFQCLSSQCHKIMFLWFEIKGLIASSNVIKKIYYRYKPTAIVVVVVFQITRLQTFKWLPEDIINCDYYPFICYVTHIWGGAINTFCIVTRIKVSS